MLRSALLVTTLALAAVPAAAQQAVPILAQPVAGTRLDVVATGEVNRVPDIANINAGVVTQAPTATAAIQQNARQMARVVAALRKAGVAERDIQTSTISLNPEYRYAENQPPALTGYRAMNSVNVRFRDIAETGRILDALVAEGANQINGPSLSIDKPQAAMDEARREALKIARARAELYAQATGKRVGRILAISESGAMPPPMPMIQVTGARFDAVAAETKLSPGEQTLSMTINVAFELE